MKENDWIKMTAGGLKDSSQSQMSSQGADASEWPGKEPHALDPFLGLQAHLPPPAVILPVLGRSHDGGRPGLCELLQGVYCHTKVHPRATVDIVVRSAGCPANAEIL